MYDLVSRPMPLMEGKGVGRYAGAKVPVSVTHVLNEPLRGGPDAVSDKNPRTPSYNAFITPVNNSGDAQQYASRPLPATPPSKTKMVDRPSTSGGPSSRRRAKSDFNFNNRTSRDDFYIGTGVHGGAGAGSFAPVQVQPPTPDSSPKTASVQRFVFEKNSRNAPTHLAIEVYSNDIGMALGSPSHPPVYSDTWNPQVVTRPRTVSPMASPPASRSSSVDTFDMPVTRKPTGKWRLFGRFMRSKPEHPVQAVSISDPNGLHGTNRPEVEILPAIQTPPPPPNSRSPARSGTISSRKAPKHKPIIVRSQTMPLEVKPDAYDQKPNGNHNTRYGGPGLNPPALGVGQGSGPMTGPLLNIEIPDVRLERYSVMFNSVLNSNTSLLSRRQATVPKLKGVEGTSAQDKDERPHGMTRRATSPQPTGRAPRATVFPTSSQTPDFVPRVPSPRLRSNTLPAFLASHTTHHDHQSPSHRLPSEKPTSSLMQRRFLLAAHDDMPGIAVTTLSDTEEQESPSLFPQFNDEDPSNIIDSPIEIESTSDGEVAWKPIAYRAPPEPKWQMINPSHRTPSTTSSYAGSYRKRSPSLASSSYTHTTQHSDSFDGSPNLDGPGNRSDSRMPSVEISIARQVSISRQQRKVFQPPRPIPAPLSASPSRQPSNMSLARTSLGSGVAAGEPGRIAETKSSTPVLVHSPGFLDPHLALAQHRKSERVVLEDY